MVKIRLRRTGKRNAPSYRIVVADSRSPRDGKFIEIIGFYNPCTKEEKVDVERAEYWIGTGAQASDTVTDLIRRAKTGEATCGKKGVKLEEPAAAEATETSETADA